MTLSTQALLGTLEGLGVSITPTDTGNLRIEPASRVPDDLKAQLRAHKAALLLELSPPPSEPEPARSDPCELGQQTGHCGSCQHWASDGFGDYLGVCALGWAAHGLPRQPGGVLITVHSTCMARDGTGWRTRSEARGPR